MVLPFLFHLIYRNNSLSHSTLLVVSWNVCFKNLILVNIKIKQDHWLYVCNNFKYFFTDILNIVIYHCKSIYEVMLKINERKQ